MRNLVHAVAGSVVLVLVSAGSASAINVGVTGTPIGSGSMPITANAGASRLVITPTGGGAALPLNCTTTSATATINTGSFVVPAAIATNVQPFFSNSGADCVGPSGFLYRYTCTATATWTATGASVAGTTPGTLSGISCTMTFTALGCTATITGSVPGSYTNHTATTDASFTVLTAGQSLAVTSNCPSSVYPSGSGQFGAPSGTGTGLSNIVYTVAGPTSAQPVIS